MARQRDEGLTETYAAAERFVAAALRTDDSLFTPGVSIWTASNANDLAARFVDAPDEGEGNFMEKLEGQLQGASDAVLQLAGEMLYVYFLGDSGPGGDAKRSLVLRVLGWIQGEPTTIPPALATALNRGFGTGGTWAATGRPVHFGYIIGFTVHWKSLEASARETALVDPWQFKRETLAVKSQANTTYMQAAIRYFAHVDSFEPIYSDKHRGMIIEALGSLAPGVDDQDQQLLAIRRALEERYGPIDFYDSNAVLALWNPGYAPWRAFLYWCDRVLAYPKFPEWEIDYKLAIAGQFKTAREQLMADDDAWVESLRSALRRQNNLINYRSADDVVQWTTSDSAATATALHALWDSGPDVLDRVAAFLRLLPKSVVSGPGGRAQLVSLLLMGEDPHRYPPFKPTEYQWAWAITGYQPEQHTDTAVYARALDFLDQIIEKGREQGVSVPDRLHAQSAMWSVLKVDESERPPEWSDLEWQGLLKLRKLAKEPQEGEPGGALQPPPAVDDIDPIDALADRLLLDAAWIRETAELLEEKRQIIFYGPPGTGKTFVAQKLAEVLASDKSRVRLVQFHPSYAYEDFIEGYRPYVLDNQQPGFRLVDGPLKRIAAAAAASPSQTFVLIIDEINRGNIAKVLGELYFLLEYRDEQAELLYSGEPFSLPANLRIIGTMNTADRSIALMDAALRRRFGFVAFFPDEYPHKGLLWRWLQSNGSPVPWIADVVERLNVELGDRNSAIGPSYFMRGRLDEERIERIWRHEIKPQLEELFFDQPERLNDLSLEALRSAAIGLEPENPTPELVAGDEASATPGTDADAQPA